MCVRVQLLCLFSIFQGLRFITWKSLQTASTSAPCHSHGERQLRKNSMIFRNHWIHKKCKHFLKKKCRA